MRHSLRFLTADHVDAILDVALNRLAAPEEPGERAAEERAAARTAIPARPASTDAGARIGQ